MTSRTLSCRSRPLSCPEQLEFPVPSPEQLEFAGRTAHTTSQAVVKIFPPIDQPRFPPCEAAPHSGTAAQPQTRDIHRSSCRPWSRLPGQVTSSSCPPPRITPQQRGQGKYIIRAMRHQTRSDIESCLLIPPIRRACRLLSEKTGSSSLHPGIPTYFKLRTRN